jgi:hypothetical protein
MIMTFRGHVKDGQIAFDEPVALPEGAAVQVEIVQTRTEQPTIWEELLELAGKAEGLPPDMAENHDHYLYGTPKKT